MLNFLNSQGKFIKTLQVKKVGTARRENYDEARAAGYTDGRNTNLNKPIAGGRTAAASVKMLN